jgi:hypothetical protein
VRRFAVKSSLIAEVVRVSVCRKQMEVVRADSSSREVAVVYASPPSGVAGLLVEVGTG